MLLIFFNVNNLAKFCCFNTLNYSKHRQRTPLDLLTIFVFEGIYLLIKVIGHNSTCIEKVWYAGPILKYWFFFEKWGWNKKLRGGSVIPRQMFRAVTAIYWRSYQCYYYWKNFPSSTRMININRELLFFENCDSPSRFAFYFFQFSHKLRTIQSSTPRFEI